jgi:hypothetical protein
MTNEELIGQGLQRIHAARFLGISRSKIYDLMNEGRLPYVLSPRARPGRASAGAGQPGLSRQVTRERGVLREDAPQPNLGSPGMDDADRKPTPGALMLYKSDREEKISRVFPFYGLKLLCLPGAVHELRIAKTSQGTILGFFTDRNKMAAWADRYSGLAPGIYFTLNPVLPDYLALANNRLKGYASKTTPDEGILQRRLLLIDADPVRQPKENSSSDAEHEAARFTPPISRRWAEWYRPVWLNRQPTSLKFDAAQPEPKLTVVGNVDLTGH